VAEPMADKQRTIEDIVSELGPIQRRLTEDEKSKKALRTEFFDAATQEINPTSLVQDLLEVEAEDQVEVEAYVVKHHPAFEIDEVRKHPEKEGFYEVIIIERPEFVPYSIDHDGWTYRRQINKGDVFVDDDRMRDEDENLWIQVTDWPYREALDALISGHDVPQEMIDGTEADDGIKYLDLPEQISKLEGAGLKRQLVNLKDLSPAIMVKIQEYMYEGPPKLVLPAPKKIKE